MSWAPDGQSANIAKQREYFRRAGEAAQAVFANEAALAYYARLLPLLDEPAEQADLHLRWGDVLKLSGRWVDAEVHFQAALQLATGGLARMAAAHLALGRLGYLHGDFQPALAWLEKARSEWEALGDRAGLALALKGLGVVAHEQGDFAAARALYTESLALARELGNKAMKPSGRPGARGRPCRRLRRAPWVGRLAERHRGLDDSHLWQRRADRRPAGPGPAQPADHPGLRRAIPGAGPAHRPARQLVHVRRLGLQAGRAVDPYGHLSLPAGPEIGAACTQACTAPLVDL
jgi:tetratricopeptide (TPR) repeat protein